MNMINWPRNGPPNFYQSISKGSYTVIFLNLIYLILILQMEKTNTWRYQSYCIMLLHPLMSEIVHVTAFWNKVKQVWRQTRTFNFVKGTKFSEPSFKCKRPQPYFIIKFKSRCSFNSNSDCKGSIILSALNLLT